MANRSIVTEYYAGRTLVKRTRSSDPLRAIQNATGYLVGQRFEDANVAQILSDDGVRVYSELKLHKNGRLETTLAYSPRDFVTPGTLHYFKNRDKP